MPLPSVVRMSSPPQVALRYEPHHDVLARLRANVARNGRVGQTGGQAARVGCLGCQPVARDLHAGRDTSRGRDWNLRRPLAVDPSRRRLGKRWARGVTDRAADALPAPASSGHCRWPSLPRPMRCWPTRSSSPPLTPPLPQRRAGRAPVAPPHPGREPVPRQQVRRCAVPPAIPGHPAMMRAWMWAALVATKLDGWLHQLTTNRAPDEQLVRYGICSAQAMITTLRWRLIAVPRPAGPPCPRPHPAPFHPATICAPRSSLA